MEWLKCRSNDKPVQSTYKTPAGMASLFGQVDEVKTTMETNFKVLEERGEKLQQLDETAQEILGGAEQMCSAFGKGGKKNKK